jgi:hypothetical protein
MPSFQNLAWYRAAFTSGYSMTAKILVLGFLFLTLGMGCIQRGAQSPSEAQARLLAAISTRNPQDLWEALDQDTRWSWLSIQRAWREAYDITLSNVPEGRERDRLQARFKIGATTEKADQLFATLLTAQEWEHLVQLAATLNSIQPQLDPSGTFATVQTPHEPVIYRKAHDRFWGWGYSGLAQKAEELKRTAAIDLEMLRKNAADYERAAARGSP